MSAGPDNGAARLLFWLLVVAAALSFGLGGYFGHSLLAEAAIFAIFAMSIDLLAGFAGLVSLGQALYFAAGAYATAVLTAETGIGPPLATLAAAAMGALLAAVLGLLALRLHGVFFLMVTLAFAEMFHAFLIGSRALGGSDGISGVPRPDLALPALGIEDTGGFALLAVALALLTWLLLRRLAAAPFGIALRALRANEERVRALGAAAFRLRLAAYVIAGALAALAGSLMAQLTGFVSPELAHWTVSGEVLVMAILGGLGTLAGPAAGAALLVLGAHHLANVTQHWMGLLGLALIGTVLFAEGGMAGGLSRLGLLWRSARA